MKTFVRSLVMYGALFLLLRRRPSCFSLARLLRGRRTEMLFGTFPKQRVKTPPPLPSFPGSSSSSPGSFPFSEVELENAAYRALRVDAAYAPPHVTFYRLGIHAASRCLTAVTWIAAFVFAMFLLHLAVTVHGAWLSERDLYKGYTRINADCQSDPGSMGVQLCVDAASYLATTTASHVYHRIQDELLDIPFLRVCARGGVGCEWFLLTIISNIYGTLFFTATTVGLVVAGCYILGRRVFQSLGADEVPKKRGGGGGNGQHRFFLEDSAADGDNEGPPNKKGD